MPLSLDMSLVLCALAPFCAAIVAPLLQPVFERWNALLLALVPALITVYLGSFIAPVAAGQTFAATIDWIPAFGIRLSFLLDGLSLTFALLIAGIGTLILIYSGSYLKGHPHQGRFLSFMLLFMGAMLGLVLSDNMIALYGFWELTTVTSFLLIGFDHTRQAARRAAIQALVVTNVGGLALLAGLIVLQQAFGPWDLSGLRALGEAVPSHQLIGFVLVAVLLAAFTKSAQMPFHFWLIGAMQAPTPVSAYLHSATMVQAGVYLLARMFPLLGEVPGWTQALVGFGTMTLLWSGLAALRQTDLKQMLAQSTVASLGLSMILLGIGTETAITAALVYFIAHALYKAALFLIAGIIEHETGTRDIAALGGLRDRMALTFIVALAATVSMVGLPPALGFFAKEETYAALLGVSIEAMVVPVAVVAGNVLLVAVALAVALKPFMGASLVTPKPAREGSFALLLAPAVFAALGLVAGWMIVWSASTVVAPAVGAVLGHAVDNHVAAGIDLMGPVFWLSVLTWVLGALMYWWLDMVRKRLRRAKDYFPRTLEERFDTVMFALVRFAGIVTRVLHHGKLELYLVVIFAMLVLALLLPMLLTGGFPGMPAWPELTFYEWAAIGLAAAGVLTVFLARTRLFAIIALGIQGLAVALLFMLFGAPDLSLTQFMVEILSVVIFALVMTRLKLDGEDPRQFEDLLRDGGLALLCGIGVVLLLLKVLETPFDARLSDFFAEYSQPLAHGRNIVNVILVDFRGLDTLGEIAVVMTAGIAVLALLRRQLAPPAPPAPPVVAKAPPKPKRIRSSAKKAAA